MNETIERLKQHRSIRKFTDKPVSTEHLQAILQAAQCAATSSHIQAYTIIQVNDSDVRHQIAALAGNQLYVAQSPLFLVFCADMHRLALAADMGGQPLEGGYMEQLLLATIDTALAAQNAMIAAESLGMGGVYIGGIRNDPRQVCELLDLPPNVYPVFGMCLGFPAQHPETKPRLPLDIIFKQDRYDDSQDQARLADYDRRVSAYYTQRTRGKITDNWTRHMANLLDKQKRPHIKDFLQSRGVGLR